VGVSKWFSKDVIVDVYGTLCGGVAPPLMSVILQGFESVDPVPATLYTPF